MSTKRRSDLIVADFLAEIGSGQLQEGHTVPPESALCATYGVSRSVVREAMRALSAKGFLSVSQGAASQISPKNRWHVLDTDFLEVNGGEEFFAELQEARDLFEPRIAALAAERISEGDLLELVEIHRRLSVTGGESPTEHADLDIAFHRTIASATGNPVLLSLHDAISSLGRRQRQVATGVDGAIERAIFWHAQILQSLQEHDSSGAEAAMGLHMRQVREELRGLGMGIQVNSKEREL